MTDLYRNADDPLGVSWPVEVPKVCERCGWWWDAKHLTLRPTYGDHNPCARCLTGPTPPLVPNPAITQECWTCQGVGSAYDDHVGNCPDCEGRGWTFRSSVRVAERVRVVSTDDDWSYEDPYPRLDASRHTVTLVELGDDGPMPRDITHLWEQPCPECGGSGVELWVHPSMGAPPRKTTCPTCNGNGTVVVPPEPGSVWEIGWREAELVPVVDSLHNPLPHIFVKTGPLDRMVWFRRISPLGVAQTTDITHHFPTPPEPGQRAGVLGELVLADKARKVQG